MIVEHVVNPLSQLPVDSLDAAQGFHVGAADLPQAAELPQQLLSPFGTEARYGLQR